MSPLVLHLLLVLAGFVGGLVNVVAGGGSFLTLPVLILLGLPSAVANGTNRVGVVVQNVAAVAGFERHGKLDWRFALWASVPASIGALLGALPALAMSDEAFKKVLALLMVVITLVTLFWRPKLSGSLYENAPPASLGHKLLLALGFFVAGLYGGFIQAGVGFLILAVTSFAGLDLVRGNAVKVLAILLSTAVSLVPFALAGKVEWGPGLLLALGMALGGMAGVRLTVLKGQRWLQGFVTVTVIAVAVRLWLD